MSGYILHSVLQGLLNDGIIQEEIKQNFAGGKPFIRIPLKYLNYDTGLMGETESFSNKLF